MSQDQVGGRVLVSPKLIVDRFSLRFLSQVYSLPVYHKPRDMSPPPTPQFSIDLPSPVSSLAFSSSTSLLAGSREYSCNAPICYISTLDVPEDGTVRRYDLPSSQVVKAIKSLGSEISSVVCVKKPNGTGDVWIASGHRVCFSVSVCHLILHYK